MNPPLSDRTEMFDGVLLLAVESVPVYRVDCSGGCGQRLTVHLPLSFMCNACCIAGLRAKRESL